MNRQHYILLIILCLGSFFGYSQSLPPIEIRFGFGMASHEPFGTTEVNGTSFQTNFLSAEAGLDVWITRSISVGFHGTYGEFQNNRFSWNNGFRGVGGDFNYKISHKLLKARFSTQQQKFFSLYVSTGLQFTSVYYENWDFGRSAIGPVAGFGLNMKIGRLRFNLMDISAAYLNNNLLSDELDNKLLLSLKSGLAIRIIDPL